MLSRVIIELIQVKKCINLYLKLFNMKNLLLIILTGILLVSMEPVIAQKGSEFPDDSVKYKKNVIRWNLTPFLIWGLECGI